jgi:AAA domain, putative AbiEii toxin, Type IV TA system
MYVRRVVLNDVKGFEHADLDLAPDENFPGWAVVTGDNGAGKTALLRSIALAILGPDQVRELAPDLDGWARHGRDTALVSVEVRPNHEYDRTRKGGFPVLGTFWAEIAIEQELGSWVLAPTDVYRKKKKGAANGPWQPVPGWFALGYGPFRRLYGSSPDAQRLMVLAGRSPQFGTLFREDATLSEAEEWIKNLQYKRLEKRQEEENTLTAVLQLLNNDFLRLGVRVDEVNSDGLWLVDGVGQRMRLRDMSEGYRAALAMLIDIFRHMVMVYGHEIVAEAADGSMYVDRPGFVMIDEVDAHLHPGWQREIGFWLKDRFPLVQFLVTTHSPLICQAADGGRIYHLPQPGNGEPFRLTQDDFMKVVSGRPDQVLLTPAFGLRNTRSPFAVDALRRHAELRAKQAETKLDGEEQETLDQLSLFAEYAIEA